MKKISRRKFIAGSLLGAVGLLLLDSLWFERYVIDWNYYDIAKKKQKLKLIQLSDLHFDSLRSFHKSIARKINKIKPDFVLITGDSVDDNSKIAAFQEFLQLIDFSIQKIAITGNWEYWGQINLKFLKDVYQQNNCELLINESRSFSKNGRQISFIGVDDLIGGNPDFPKAAENLQASETIIVLSHCPQHRDIIQQQKGDLEIDLILSGHTHGGQINLFGWAPYKPPGSGDYLKGWYKENGPLTYVSKGIGTSLLPIRFGARAEVVEIDI